VSVVVVVVDDDDDNGVVPGGRNNQIRMGSNVYEIKNKKSSMVKAINRTRFVVVVMVMESLGIIHRRVWNNGRHDDDEST
jgi:hypothetical protein